MHVVGDNQMATSAGACIASTASAQHQAPRSFGVMPLGTRTIGSKLGQIGANRCNTGPNGCQMGAQWVQIGANRDHWSILVPLGTPTAGSALRIRPPFSFSRCSSSSLQQIITRQTVDTRHTLPLNCANDTSSSLDSPQASISASFYT